LINRFYKKYPSLTAPHNSQPPDNWTNHLSRGSLKISSDNLFKAVLQLERDFKTFHGDILSKKPQVFKNLYKLVAPKIQHLNIPDKVILCLIRTRTYICLFRMNVRLHYFKNQKPLYKTM
ncbi:piggyBac transposable element-derived protein 4-like, partial [Aphis craccivora]